MDPIIQWLKINRFVHVHVDMLCKKWHMQCRPHWNENFRISRFQKETAMTKKPIAMDDFRTRTHYLWHRQWLLLAAGDFKKKDYNVMTVGWGGFGTMWDKPFVMVVVRPNRYTFQFMNQYDSFTLSAFPRKYRKVLEITGSTSGRDIDKIHAAEITPVSASKVTAPVFVEAELSIECRKIYCADFDPSRFLDEAIEGYYPQKDYHRMFFGEILSIKGSNAYTSKIL